jgi:UDP-N-acetylmuramate--alanine ligase
VSGDLMVKTVDFNGKPFHFIGIGGIGMSALAHILAQRQLPVFGSDVKASNITRRLQAMGAKIFHRQEAKNLSIFESSYQVPTLVSSSGEEIKSQTKLNHGYYLSQTQSFPQVICSTAINDDNPEYKAAKELGYPIFHRSDVLAALIDDYHSVAVAGTHGKTTTSSLIAYVLFQAGLDPTIIVGGEVDAWEGNARLGAGQYLVAEADESDGSLTKHAPNIGIITNIELDHTDHYQSLADVINTFQVFATQSECLIACWDCQTIRNHLQPDITYSLASDSDADYTVKNVIYHTQGSRAEVWEKGQYLGLMIVPLLGEHNLSNSLAAVAVGRKLGLEFAIIANAIASFGGAKRRFEYRGEAGGVTFIDDYAHHPSEIRCTLSAARLRLQENHYQRIVAIFQPHRYSRTATFLEEFATAFTDADLVIITEIYSAGEVNTPQISGQMVADAIATYHPRVYYHPSLASLGSFLGQMFQTGDLALFLGAGNLNQIIPELTAVKAA